jgi:hypothetical protein
MNLKSLPIRFSLTVASALLSTSFWVGQSVKAKYQSDSPLGADVQVSLDRARRFMKSGKADRATAVVQSALDSANDVPRCLAIASFTESWGAPMNELRRACLNKALSLCTSRDDTVLVALKSRQYQFFEITRQAVTSLIGNAKTVPDLYDLARKSQEVALNDVAHLAMEKAYMGIRDQQGAYAYAEQCKALGMDDLLRKVIKDMIDDEDNVADLCTMIVKFEGYQMRDQNRYGLRKAMDKAVSVADMENIFEASRRLGENDIANRAQYFVRKGKLIQKIKDDRAAYEAQLRAWREGVLQDAQAQAAAAGDSGFSSSTGKFGGSGKSEPPGSGF